MDPRQWLWALRFLATCNTATSRSTTLSSLAPTGESRHAFDTMMAAEKLDCDFSAAGKLVLFPNTAGFGLPANAVAAGDAQPATSGQLQRLLGHRTGIGPLSTPHRRRDHAPGECAADCQTVCSGFAEVLRARGVVFLLGTAIDRLVVKNSRVAAVATTQGDVEANDYVMSLSAASALLAQPLGVILPVYPLKGYSISVEVGAKAHRPSA